MTTPDYQKALGRKIAAERRRRGLSQPELARMIDRSVAWVSQVERGVRKVDRMSVLEALAAALEVPLAELAAEAYDKLVAETIEAIKAGEPGTLVYASHTVEGQPLQRIFYELYRDRAAFEAHEASPHTRRYLEARGQYLASTEVDWLTLQTGKGTEG